MDALIRRVLDRSRWIVAAWLVILALAAGFAARLPQLIQGSSDAIEDSESGRVTAELHRRFGAGTAFLFAVVVESDRQAAGDAHFAAGVEALAGALLAVRGVRSVDHYWNTGDAALLGRDGRSALVLVQPGVTAFFEAENLTAALREASSRAGAARGLHTTVTGMPALFHDLNRSSSADLMRAERIGVPVTLLILLVVFGAPLAAALPLLVALLAVTVAMAGLALLSALMPVSVFAQNAVAMVGLGLGVDYALLLLTRFRAQLALGDPLREAVISATAAAGHALAVSGAAVGIGFLGLLLVKAKFLHSVALGGILVVACALLATLTLLPVLLLWLGRRLDWPRSDRLRPGRGSGGHERWDRWVGIVMRRPWQVLLPALAVTASLALPALRMTPANAGVRDLPPQFEARRGFEALQRNFVAGWMGPVALLLEAAPGRNLRDAGSQTAIRALAERLGRDARVAAVRVPREALSPDGAAALLVLVTRHGPESPEAFAYLQALRSDAWPEAVDAGLSVRVGGPTAMIEDFDAELIGSLRVVIPAVLALSFLVLAFAFRSLLIPVKAIALNLLSVLAAYGFLVLVFQDGIGAALLGIDPPGGLTSLVVLMLFTILFGISMDYEIFLLRQVQEEYRRTRDNRRAVQSGVARSAALITSAAAIMVVLFGSFGFTQFTATREFGLGLAAAVAIDATVIRLLIAPALMQLFGTANWWWPFSRSRSPARRQSIIGLP